MRYDPTRNALCCETMAHKARKTNLVRFRLALAPVPFDGRVLCSLLVAAVRGDLLAFCNKNQKKKKYIYICIHSRSLPCISAIPPPRGFIAARLSLCITFIAVPSRTQCSHANAAMYRSPVLFPPAAPATPPCSVLPGASRRGSTVLIVWQRRKTPAAVQQHHICVSDGLRYHRAFHPSLPTACTMRADQL